MHEMFHVANEICTKVSY